MVVFESFIFSRATSWGGCWLGFCILQKKQDVNFLGGENDSKRVWGGKLFGADYDI